MSQPSSLNILAINPGSTTTKVALYEGDGLLAEKKIRHEPGELASFGGIMEQKEYRVGLILGFLEERRFDPYMLDAVVGRGGLLRPMESGTYQINEKMLQDLRTGFAASHASSLGAIVAVEIAEQYGKPAFIVDPVAVDELEPRARFSGLPGISRRSLFHALNTKAVARNCAEALGIRYEDARFIVAHMGGGISVGAHRYGRVIDVNDALFGEGPFSVERSGGVPLSSFAEMCFSGRYKKEEILTMVQKRGGMMAYLGTNDMIAAEKMARDGDPLAIQVLDAMAYQIGKEIGGMAAALEGRVDAVLLTGGLANSSRFVAEIKRYSAAFGPVLCFPGEMEMQALARGAIRVLTGQEKAKAY